MFYQERQAKILERIEAEERVEVTDLSQWLNVSHDTIRRDLRQMEKEGLIQRTHGGAILPKKQGVALSYSARKKIYQKEKTRIAKEAATYIRPNDTLLIDSATTTEAMIPYLGNISGLTVFTNSIQIATEIDRLHRHIKVFLIGGLINHDSGNILSTDCLTYIQKLYVDIVFLGSCSISSQRGLGSTTTEDAAIKKAMIHAGKKVIILADNTKFSRTALMHFSPLESHFLIITDDAFSLENQQAFSKWIEKGLEIKVAP